MTAGCREVTLLGQNVDAYGRDLPGFAADNSGRRAWTFTDLLRYVHDVPGGWGWGVVWVGGWVGWWWWWCVCVCGGGGWVGGGGDGAGQAACVRAAGCLEVRGGLGCMPGRSLAPLPQAERPAPPLVPLAGIERIRFATSHPRYFTERLIK